MAKVKGKDVRIKLDSKLFLGCTDCTINRTRDELDASTKDGKDFLVGDEIVDISGNGVLMTDTGSTSTDYPALEALYEAGDQIVASWLDTSTGAVINAKQSTGVITSLNISAAKDGVATIAFTFKGGKASPVTP